MTTYEYSVDAYPYRHGGEALTFESTECLLDGDEHEIPDDPSQISLVDETEWTTASLTVEVSIDDDTLDHVFPSVGSHDGALIVTEYCPSTHGRSVKPIAIGDFDSGEHEGEVEIERESFRGLVSLEPQLLRNSHRSVDDEYASESGRILANGARCDVYIDEPKLTLSGDLPVIPAKFSEDGNPGKEGLEWYVDVRDADTPKLWVNKDYPTVVNAINSIENPTKQGITGRVVLNHLAVSMLTQFTIKAASHAVTQNEIQYEWQQTLLTDICSDYFTDGTVEEFKESLQIEAISTTMNKIETIYQRRRAPHEDVKRLLEMMSG